MPGASIVLIYLPRWEVLLRTISVFGLNPAFFSPGEPLFYLASGLLASFTGLQGYVPDRRLLVAVLLGLAAYSLGVALYITVDLP